MRQAAVRSRKVPQMASEGAAEIPARTLRETPVARAFPLDLRPLILPYRVHRCLTLRIEELPQRARLSAGQNNGDCSWSVTLDELEGLSYCPPQGFDGQHDLKLRIISKDETGASTVALLDFHVICDDEHANAATAQSSGKIAPSPQDGALREEIASLRAACAAQDAELSAMRTSSEQVHAQWEKNLAKSLTEAEAAWKSAEALRLDAAMADLQTRFDRDLADMNRSAQAKADASGKRDAAMLRRLNQELSDTKDALAGKDTELAELRDRLERLRHDADTEIAAAKEAAALEAAEQLKAAETQWQEQAASSMAEVTARCRAAEEALASARAADTGKTDADAELAELHDRLERLRHDADTEIAAAKEAAALEAAEQLKAAETQWQEQAASSMAEVTARCRAAEEALASASAADTGKTDADAELAELRARLERLRHDADTEIAAAKEAAALEAAEQLKAAETQWQEQAARSVAEVTARCRAAEEALASASAADTGKANADDAYIRRLNCEIKSLQNSLVEREADLAHAQTQLREMRPRSATPGPVGNWQPLSSIPADAENEGAKNSGHLWRDTVMVFVVVVGTAICWPWIEHALTTAGVVELLTRRHAVVEATPKSTPGPEHPTAIVARGVNLRAGPRTSAAVLATLTSGMRVTILGHSGNWDKVENSGADGKTRQGWVYNSYLDASRAENPKK